ncbi:hypothetical protein, partial [Gluconobacter cerinus]|uniref:hypothetical protein n=1 Tax=Gluconobacter cerinus TaxID=38307 RepID=UPI001B8AEE25
PGKRFELITKPAQSGKSFFNIKETRLFHSAFPSTKAEGRESHRKPQKQRFFRTLQIQRKNRSHTKRKS